MSEEFKPIRITLSEEAFTRLDKIMKDAKFRSYSSTIEECIRVISDIIGDVKSLTDEVNGKIVTIHDDQMIDTLLRISLRMTRFTKVSLTRHRD